jgi:hypothetical protein
MAFHSLKNMILFFPQEVSTEFVSLMVEIQKRNVKVE